MNDRLRRLLIVLGPVIGALLLYYVIGLAIDTYTVGVEELETERRAEATAEAQQAMSETVELTGSGTETGTNPIDVTESITAILPNTVTEEINLDAALTETVPATGTEGVTGTEEVTATEGVTATEAVTETATDAATETEVVEADEEVTAAEEVTATEEVTASETITE